MTPGSLNNTGATRSGHRRRRFLQINDGNQFCTRVLEIFRSTPTAKRMASADQGRLLEPGITIPQDTLQITTSSTESCRCCKPVRTNSVRLTDPISRFINPRDYCRRTEPVAPRSQVREPIDFNTRPGRTGHDQAAVSRDFERRTGDGAGEHDHHTADLRAQLAGDSSRRPSLATGQ